MEEPPRQHGYGLAHGYETLVERQIRLAQERGDFDDLPGKGKPLPGLDGPDDENWWLKGYLRREGLSTEPLLPTPLQLRREIERLPDTVAGLPDERAVRGLSVRSTGGSRSGCWRRWGPRCRSRPWTSTPSWPAGAWTATPCATAGPPSAARPTPPRAPTVPGGGGGSAADAQPPSRSSHGDP